MNRKYIWANHQILDFKKMPYRNSYRNVSGIFEFPVDRFGIAEGMLELDTVNILNEPNYNLDSLSNDWRDRYFDMLDAVSDKVYKTAGDDKIIYILYSGGLDSICVLVALLRNKKFNEFLDADRIKISMTSASIQENPEYFYTDILPNFPICVLNYDTLMNDEHALLVTGDFGDHVIGSSDTIKLSAEGIDLTSPYDIFFNSNHKFIKENEYLELVRLVKNNQPFEIESIGQLFWWFNQCFSLQSDIVLPYIWSTTDDFSSISNNDKVFKFFYDEMITTYSYEYMSTNPRLVHFEDGRQFLKDYIVNQTKKEYFYNKTKIYSQRQTLRTVQKTRIYLEDDIIWHDMSAEKISLGQSDVS